jgi:hypothetical protein
LPKPPEEAVAQQYKELEGPASLQALIIWLLGMYSMDRSRLIRERPQTTLSRQLVMMPER